MFNLCYYRYTIFQTTVFLHKYFVLFNDCTIALSGVFRGALVPAPPLQQTVIFYDGIFGCFTNFFILKHQNLGIQ